MPKTVFISYSRHDYSFAERLVDDLLAHGISTERSRYFLFYTVTATFHFVWREFSTLTSARIMKVG
jgi:hypothetical protein